MEEQKVKAEKIVEAFWLQLIANVWEIDGENRVYRFTNDFTHNNGKIYNLTVTDKQTNLMHLEVCELESNGISCFLSFLGKRFKILKIVNKEYPHIMQLEDSEGNISFWLSNASF